MGGHSSVLVEDSKEEVRSSSVTSFRTRLAVMIPARKGGPRARQDVEDSTISRSAYLDVSAHLRRAEPRHV